MKSLIVILSWLAMTSHAGEILTFGNAKKIAQEPAECIDTDQICAVKTFEKEKFKLRIGQANIILSEKTAIVRNSTDSLTLLQGEIWVQSEAEFTIKSEYGSVSSRTGSFIVSREPKKLFIEALDAPVTLKPRLGSTELSLEAGERNWLGPIDQNRISSSGIPLPIDPNQLLFRWAKIYPGTKQSFHKEFEKFLDVWRISVAGLAAHHSELAKRRVASITAETERKNKILKAQQQEELRIRAWFRQKELSD